jgi:hypothetical protein
MHPFRISTPLEDATQIQRLVRPFQEFAKLEAAGGILLIGCILAALNEVTHQVLTGSTSETPCWVFDQSPIVGRRAERE